VESIDQLIGFKSIETDEVFIFNGLFARPLIYSPDGIKYFELHRTGLRWTAESCVISFEDPHHNQTGELKRNKVILIWSGKTFTQFVGPDFSKVEVIPLPKVRIPQYLFKLKGGKYLYVSDDKYSSSYDSFRLFLGKPDQMEEIPVDKPVVRYRDGGTTIIKTPMGDLFSPTPFEKELKPTWKEQEIKELKTDKYVIEEFEEFARLVKKEKP
jgi:hypothetical protein